MLVPFDREGTSNETCAARGQANELQKTQFESTPPDVFGSFWTEQLIAVSSSGLSPLEDIWAVFYGNSVDSK